MNSKVSVYSLLSISVIEKLKGQMAKITLLCKVIRAEFFLVIEVLSINTPSHLRLTFWE